MVGCCFTVIGDTLRGVDALWCSGGWGLGDDSEGGCSPDDIAVPELDLEDFSIDFRLRSLASRFGIANIST